MKKFKIEVEKKEHFKSLIKDFRANGFMLITYGEKVAELENGTEFITIIIK